MCNTFAVYFQIFATFGYKKVKNSDIFGIQKQVTKPALGLEPFEIRNCYADNRGTYPCVFAGVAIFCFQIVTLSQILNL